MATNERNCVTIKLYLKEQVVGQVLPTPALRDRKGDGTHSSTLAWKIPWMEEPGGLHSMGSLRVGHD